MFLFSSDFQKQHVIGMTWPDLAKECFLFRTREKMCRKKIKLVAWMHAFKWNHQKSKIEFWEPLENEFSRIHKVKI